MAYGTLFAALLRYYLLPIHKRGKSDLMVPEFRSCIRKSFIFAEIPKQDVHQTIEPRNIDLPYSSWVTVLDQSSLIRST